MNVEPERAQGKSFIVREGEDLAHWVFIGDVDAEEMRRIGAQQAVVMAGCTRVLSLVDLSSVGKVTAGARKVGAESSRLNVIAVAIYGASFQVRVIATLVITAGVIFRQMKPEEAPVRFFESEREARAWLDVRRAELAAQRG